jgi:hypothetical protein
MVVPGGQLGSTRTLTIAYSSTKVYFQEQNAEHIRRVRVSYGASTLSTVTESESAAAGFIFNRVEVPSVKEALKKFRRWRADDMDGIKILPTFTSPLLMGALSITMEGTQNLFAPKFRELVFCEGR